MGTPFLSEIRLMSFAFPPSGWALCNGQSLPIIQYQALFSLLGTAFGGDGVHNFNLPDLRGRVPMHTNQTYPIGAAGGEASHSLGTAEIASHSHNLLAVAQPAPTHPVVPPGPAAAIAEPVAAVSGGGTAAVQIYAAGSPTTEMAANAVAQNPGGQPHPNQQPFLVLNYCIALQGIYPTPG